VSSKEPMHIGEIMGENDAQKYILEQAKIEVEHTRSWPTKVMAFYVAINFGLIASLIAIQKTCSFFALPCLAKVILTLLIIIQSVWVYDALKRNHLNYLKYRNLQINFQMKHLQYLNDELPNEWFKVNEVRLSCRFHGWGFYLYIDIMVALLALAAIFLL
jgi:hypothetical protein